MFPATLFDYNGVLVDDEHVHLAAFREVLAPMGIELDERAYWDRYLGFDDVGAFRAILTDHGRSVSDEAIAALVERKRPVYLGLADGGLHAFEGAAELVRRQASRGPVAVVSGALRDEITLGLRLLGVEDLVPDVVAAEDTKHSKPHPEGYVLGIRALDRRAGSGLGAQALVVEDSTAGVQAAKAAGLVCVAVTHSYAAEELRAAGADAVFTHLDEIDDAALEDLYRQVHG